MSPFLFSKVVFKILTILKKTTVKWKLKRKFPHLFFLPHMERNEYSLFKKISRNAVVFLEYGSGGSTIFLLKKKKEIFSVESNPEFYKFMNSIEIVKKSLGKNLQYKFIDLGPTNQWGKPLKAEDNGHWVEYYSAIWNDIDPAINKIDVVFIDGRFRICCCLYSILKLVEYRRVDALIVIHDFWRRTKYHVVLEFLQEVKSASNLAVLKIRENVDVDKLKEMTGQYALVTA